MINTHREQKTPEQIAADVAKWKATHEAISKLSEDEQIAIIEKGVLDGSIPISARP